jgi:small multidrug resistance family-3 protein
MSFGLFVVTAAAEIGGCYLVYLWLRAGKGAWLLAPAAVSLALFAFLLTLHPASAGRTYAAYGCVYVATAIGWLWIIVLRGSRCSHASRSSRARPAPAGMARCHSCRTRSNRQASA